MNIQPLQSFLEKEISPTELARLLDELFLDYLDRSTKLYVLDNEVHSHADTAQFFYMIRRLCEVLKTL